MKEINVKAYKFGTTLLFAGAVALPAAADDFYYDTARVLVVVPQTERVNTPLQECHTEYTRDSYQGRRDLGGAIIGGIAGGLLGSQIGRGDGRVAGAAVGAATGAIVGDRIGNSGQHGYAARPVQRCTTVDNWQTVNRGYLVTYRYNDRIYNTNMPYDPGNMIRLQVSVAPGYRNNVVSYVPGYQQREDGWHRGWGKRRDHDDERRHD
jgi:uncharacterized protein YcfJ